jgi:hypothetical protein
VTPSDLATSCDACGERAPFTGNVEQGARGLVAVCACPRCRTELRVWRPADAPRLQAWREAASTGDARWHHSWQVLRSGDAPSLRVLFRDAAENTAWPMPLVRLRELPFGADLPLTAWLFIVLDGTGLRPEPTPAERLEEALVAGIQAGDEEAARALVARRQRYAESDWLGAFQALPARAAAAQSGRALRPVLEALRGTAARAFAEKRWVKPGLREALESR